jgi:hypothetical protein
LGSGESGTVAVTMTATKGATLGDRSAVLSIAAGGAQVAHAAVYTFVK